MRLGIRAEVGTQSFHGRYASHPTDLSLPFSSGLLDSAAIGRIPLPGFPAPRNRANLFQSRHPVQNLSSLFNDFPTPPLKPRSTRLLLWNRKAAACSLAPPRPASPAAPMGKVGFMFGAASASWLRFAIPAKGLIRFVLQPHPRPHNGFVPQFQSGTELASFRNSGWWPNWLRFAAPSGASYWLRSATTPVPAWRRTWMRGSGSAHL
jgi:hypothetical protein